VRFFALSALLYLTGCANTGARSDPSVASYEHIVEIGMPWNAAVDVIKLHGGVDIGRNLAVLGDVSEVFWSLRDYNGVLELGSSDSTLSHIAYWSSDDFGHSKLRREQTRRRIRSIRFHPESRTVSVSELQ
jgi:hypothetical protein